MTLTFTLNAAPLPMPSQDNGIRIENLVVGVEREMLDGTLRVQYRAIKHRITISWEGLTKAEHDTVISAWQGNIATAQTLVLPDTQTFSVMAGKNAMNEAPWFDYGGTPRYDMSVAFREV